MGSFKELMMVDDVTEWLLMEMLVCHGTGAPCFKTSYDPLSGDESSSIIYQYLPFFALCFAELITMRPIASSDSIPPFPHFQASMIYPFTPLSLTPHETG